MTQRWRLKDGALIEEPLKSQAAPAYQIATAKLWTLGAIAAVCIAPIPGVLAQPYNCHAYARAYADAHVNPGGTDLEIYDRGSRGAVVGGIWAGPSGAERGAKIGGALAVLDNLGNYPAGWRSLYDLAYRMCVNEQSSVTHHPTTLGDPTYRGRPLIKQQAPPPALDPRPQLAPPPPPSLPSPPPAAPRR
ncbi:hypothetical protein [Labrenzia sp. PHM005]|uniref:hypothetical protein n=1 Tax=Labrenzia sp. PHM005 TaxID=2590016 RepID=UPI00114072EA|nr:hypothetical protein [Labrenzia sp. PHM005]QDG77414.1 hypothetical protein FJ695_16885 [Labrenzia sp. PHM005]